MYLDPSFACWKVGAHDEVRVHAGHLKQNLTHTLHLRISNGIFAHTSTTRHQRYGLSVSRWHSAVDLCITSILKMERRAGDFHGT